jgi:alanine-glyoxylate transaminase/serine-glyoxylate transaminase/serine-pyruvate transaminase
MRESYSELKPPMRILMGPGPSDVDPRVLRAMSAPLIGHLDPDFIAIMDETKELLKHVFQTQNDLTIPISGTGSAGMEACLSNVIEPGGEVMVCVNGYFGERMCDMVDRCGGELTRVDAPWGEIIEPDQVARALRECRAEAVAIVHAETSTGVLQPLEEISEIVHQHDALLVVDAVTSLGGVPVEVDKWGIDACYSGTQKCISCPPGLSPATFSERYMSALKGRKTKVQSWYLDLSLLHEYWGPGRSYHHTAPITMNYGLREALRLIYEEGLQRRFARHELNAKALAAGLHAMGLKLLVPEAYRLPSLTSVVVPESVGEARVRQRLLREAGIEIGGGLGELRAKIWRIGLMGYSSQSNNVLLALSALEHALANEGFDAPPAAGADAAYKVLESSAREVGYGSGMG